MIASIFFSSEDVGDVDKVLFAKFLNILNRDCLINRGRIFFTGEVVSGGALCLAGIDVLRQSDFLHQNVYSSVEGRLAFHLFLKFRRGLIFRECLQDSLIWYICQRDTS